MLIHTIFGLASALLYAYLSFNDKRSADEEDREARAASA